MAARLVGLQRSSEGFRVRVRKGGRIQCLSVPLVADATGRPAAVGRWLGARRIRRSLQLAYPCKAAALPPDRLAWLNVWGDEADWAYQLEGPGGLTESWRIGPRRAGQAGGVDASTSRLQPPAGPGWVAVGDAASAFNPIWSEGLSNALGTSTMVAGALLAHGAITQQVCDVYAAAVVYGAPTQ